MELFKWLDSRNIEHVTEILNNIFNDTENPFPETLKQANIIPIFKKGDSSQCSNFRPISLLNSIYKIFASILQSRISQTLDPYLHKLQFGFRKERSTAQALHIIRRDMATAASTQTNAYLLLLDWEKAFDKVHHHALFLSMERVNIDPHLIRLTQMLYASLKFYSEIGLFFAFKLF